MAEFLRKGTVTVVVICRDLRFHPHSSLRALEQGLNRIEAPCPLRVILLHGFSEFPFQFKELSNTQMEIIRADFPLSWSSALDFVANRYDSEFYFVMDQNISVPAGILTGMLEFCRTEPWAGVVAPRLMNPNGTIHQAGFLMSKRGPVPYKKNHSSQILHKEFQAVGGACVLVRRAVLDDLGGLDPSAGLVDVDLCLRARQHGWRVFCLCDIDVLCLPPAERTLLKRSRKDLRRFRRRWSGRYTLDLLHRGLLNPQPSQKSLTPSTVTVRRLSPARVGLRRLFLRRRSIGFQTRFSWEQLKIRWWRFRGYV